MLVAIAIILVADIKVNILYYIVKCIVLALKIIIIATLVVILIGLSFNVGMY